jgi:hypothetical protein
MRTRHLGIALFALGAMGASSAWGSVELAGTVRISSAASILPMVAQRGQFGMLDAQTAHQFSEINLMSFADKKDDDKKNEPPPPPPKRSGKCPPGHGGDDHGDDNGGHDCRGDK